jgi:hypothetical protein
VFSQLRGQLTYANVVATLALFLALTGGVAWALERNSVKSKHIVDDQVQSADVRDDSLAGGGLTGDDIQEGTLAQVPQANSANSAGTAGSAFNAGLLDNIDSSGFVRPNESFYEIRQLPGDADEENPGPANDIGSEIAACDVGDLAIGGGFQTNDRNGELPRFLHNEPSGNQWTVVWQNDADPYGITVTTICLDRTPYRTP